MGKFRAWRVKMVRFSGLSCCGSVSGLLCCRLRLVVIGTLDEVASLQTSNLPTFTVKHASVLQVSVVYLSSNLRESKSAALEDGQCMCRDFSISLSFK
jgi:hypothetical protein